MNIYQSEPIIALNKLSDILKIDSLSFIHTMTLLTGFSNAVFVKIKSFNYTPVNEEVYEKIDHLLNVASKFIDNKISSSDLKKARIEAWKLHDLYSVNSIERNLLRVTVCCLYDKKSAGFDIYGSEPMIETFIAVLADLGNGYCSEFVDYVKSH